MAKIDLFIIETKFHKNQVKKYFFVSHSHSFSKLSTLFDLDNPLKHKTLAKAKSPACLAYNKFSRGEKKLYLFYFKFV
jgi:hypothetical protein